MTLFYTILTIGSITDFKNLRINSHFRGTFIVFREVIINSDHTTKCLMWLRHSGKSINLARQNLVWYFNNIKRSEYYHQSLTNRKINQMFRPFLHIELFQLTIEQRV